jgi:hypothetical protein
LLVKIRSITVAMGRTYNMGNYEAFRIDGAVTVDLDEDETPAEARAAAFPILREQMRETYKEFKPKRETPK